MQNEVLARVEPSALLRWIGLSVIATLGVLLLWMGVAGAQVHAIWRVVLVALGFLSLVLGVRMHAATAVGLVLTRDGLRDGNGVVLADADEIEGIERGAFAFKPSKGFVLVLKKAKPRAWMPGLWWRWGRRVGVGGVTPGHQTKAMAEAIQTLLSDRA